MTCCIVRDLAAPLASGDFFVFGHGGRRSGLLLSLGQSTMVRSLAGLASDL